MNATSNHLDQIAEIRSIMEKSSRFISLSGLSGVFAGVYALIGASIAYFYLELSITSARSYGSGGVANPKNLLVVFVIAVIVLIAAVGTGILLTIRSAKKNNQSIWDSIAKRMIMNLSIPLITGGLFCLLLIYHGILILIAPAMLIFYGLALINGSKYTLNEIRYLGMIEIGLGLLATFFTGYGFIFWVLGFGFMHIIYGIAMYNKYEK